MEKIALELWTSQYDIKGNLMTTSSVCKIVMHNNFKKPWDVLGDYIFINWKNRKLENFDHHLFQFQVWKKSMFSKFIVEGIFLTIFTILFQYYLISAINAANSVTTAFSTYSNSSSSLTSLYTTFETYSATYYSSMQATVYLGFISLWFPIKIVLCFAFSYKTKRVFNFLTFNNLLDICICGIFLTRIIYEYNYYRDNVSISASDTTNGPKYYDNINRKRSDSTLHSYLYATGSALLWLRILMLFKLTRFLGPLVKMIENMLNEIVIFMVLFTIELIIFASIGSILFNSIGNYSSLYEALKILFSSALGNFDFTTLYSNDKSEVLGAIYIVWVVVVNNILILNLLIAILSSTYALLEDKKLVLYINEILTLRNTLEYDKRCSSIVSTFPPFNLIALFLTPFIIFINNPKKLNSFLFHLEYIPFLLLITPVYIALNLVLIPFGYLKGNILNLQQICRKKMEVTIQYRILRFFIFFFFGVIILLLNLWADLVLFVIHCYQHKLHYRKERVKIYKLTKDSFNKLYNKIEKELKNQNKIVDPQSIVVHMREEIELSKYLQILIFGFSHDFIQHSTDDALKKIDEYVLLKRVINSLSLPAGIYTENLKSLMTELKMTSKIRSLISFEENLISLSTRVLSIEHNSHLSKMHYINLNLLNKAIDSLSEKKIDLVSIKHVVELALYENSHLFTKQPTKLNYNRIDTINRQATMEKTINTKQMKKIKSSLTRLIEEYES